MSSLLTHFETNDLFSGNELEISCGKVGDFELSTVPISGFGVCIDAIPHLRIVLQRRLPRRAALNMLLGYVDEVIGIEPRQGFWHTLRTRYIASETERNWLNDRIEHVVDNNPGQPTAWVNGVDALTVQRDELEGFQMLIGFLSRHE